MSMQPVRTLPLAPTVLSRLEAAGFHTCGEFGGMGPVDLAAEANISLDEAQHCLRLANRSADGAPGSLPTAFSARDLLDQERDRKSIFTFCAELDSLLGGGVAPCEAALQGSGRHRSGTQPLQIALAPVPQPSRLLAGSFPRFPSPLLPLDLLSIQLSVAVQLPAAFSGLAGEAVYIDTEGSFMVDRVVEMADACVKHIRNIAAGHGDAATQAAAAAYTRESILRGIHYFRVQNATEQRAVLESLPAFVAERGGRVKLVVVDSVAFHYRQDFEDMHLRTRILGQMNAILMKLADTEKLAVVTMNQVTTKVLPGGGAKMVPALGESYAHSCTTRVMLTWDQGERAAELYKSPRLPQGRVNFNITTDGVRSIRSNKRSAGRQLTPT